MDYIVLDTDVASLIHKRRVPRPLAARLAGKVLCVTFVTVGELTQWAELRNWGRRNRVALEDWLDSVIELGYDGNVARTWVAYRLPPSPAAALDQSMTPGSPHAASRRAFPSPP